jgi:hypothetical protein
VVAEHPEEGDVEELDYLYFALFRGSRLQENGKKRQ